MLIEFLRESGSPDLPAYVEHFADIIAEPSPRRLPRFGRGQLRAALVDNVSARHRRRHDACDVLEEGVHSGDASGIVPSSFRIARQILTRLEDETTGAIRPEGLHVEIPEQRKTQAGKVASVLAGEVFSRSFLGRKACKPSPAIRLSSFSTARGAPALAVTGQEGIPALKDAGNVLRPYTTLNLSIRIPPTLDPLKARDVVQELLTSEPPYGAKVTLHFHEPAPGWSAPELAAWLGKSLDEASRSVLRKARAPHGRGRLDTVHGHAGRQVSRSPVRDHGRLRRKSNAHGPNEFLHIEYAKKLTGCVTHIFGEALQPNGMT